MTRCARATGSRSTGRWRWTRTRRDACARRERRHAAGAERLLDAVVGHHVLGGLDAIGLLLVVEKLALAGFRVGLDQADAAFESGHLLLRARAVLGLLLGDLFLLELVLGGDFLFGLLA